MKTYLKVPENRVIQLHDLIAYLDAVFNGLWAYRFLHRDLEHLLANDERLRDDYRHFTLYCLSSIKQIAIALEDSEIYVPLREEQRDSTALNTWLIVTNWMTFLKSVHEEGSERIVNREAIKHGVFLVLDYLAPYIREDKREIIRTLQTEYRFSDIIPLE